MWYSCYSFLASAPDGVSSQPRTPAALCPREDAERTSGTHWVGGWVGLRAGLDTEARGEILYLCRESNAVRPGYSQALYWLSYPWFYFVYLLTATGDIAVSSRTTGATPVLVVYLCTGRKKTDLVTRRQRVNVIQGSPFKAENCCRWWGLKLISHKVAVFCQLQKKKCSNLICAPCMLQHMYLL
jgi:hypothetical protein